jgi:hypothetical protein
MIGSVLSPALSAMTEVINFLTNSVEAAIGGFIKLVGVIAAVIFSIKDGMMNAVASIKDFFTGSEDPVGIIEGFSGSFMRGLEIANIASDEFLTNLEMTKKKMLSVAGDFETKMKGGLQGIGIEGKKAAVGIMTGLTLAFSSLQTALLGAEEGNKSFAKAAAAIAMAMAIINTAQGITKAFADYTWPFSLVVAGIVAAAGAIQIATIASQKFHEGGIIRAHNGLAVDEVPIIAQTGEGVLSRRGMAALGGENVLNSLNSGGYSGGQSFGDVNISLTAVINNNMDIKDIADQLGFEIRQQRQYSRSF